MSTENHGSKAQEYIRAYFAYRARLIDFYGEEHRFGLESCCSDRQLDELAFLWSRYAEEKAGTGAA